MTDKRRYRRRLVSQPAQLLRDDGSLMAPCQMLDVSAGGARLQFAAEQQDIPWNFTLLLSQTGTGPRRRCTLVWTKGAQIGVRFVPT